MIDVDGDTAWEVLDPETREKIKERILEIYEGEGVMSPERLEKETNFPIPVIATAIVELIEQGEIVEDNVDIPTLSALIRRTNYNVERLIQSHDYLTDTLSKTKKAEQLFELVSQYDRYIKKKREESDEFNDILTVTEYYKKNWGNNNDK